MKDNYFFDNAATTWPKPEAVYVAMDRFYREHGVNPGRSGYELALQAGQMIAETRKLLTEFFNCTGDPNRLIFTTNATEALNIALFGLLNPGDHVIATRLEHNAVLRPLNHLQRDYGVAVTYVRRDGLGFVDPADIKRAATPATKVVIVNHGSNVLGSVQDLTAIGTVAKDLNAVFVVDTCQTAGVLPIDAQTSHIDVVTFTGHKGLFGPMGTGGLFVREGLNPKLRNVGGTGVDSISPFQPDLYPYRLESGTPNLPGIAGLNAAQRWIAALGREQATGQKLNHREACRLGMQRIHHREMDLLGRLLNGIEGTKKLTVYGPRNLDRRVATLSLNIDGMNADQLGSVLDADFHIATRNGLHCAPLVHEDEKTVSRKGTVRFAPGYFTTDDEVDHAIKALNEIAATWS